MASFKVQAYRDFFDEEPTVERTVNAVDHKKAAALVVKQFGGDWVDWVRVTCLKSGQVVRFLDCRWSYSGGLEYESKS